MRVAVVGAGIMGSSVAYSMTRRGHTVTVIEQFELGHDKGSSHGRSRIVRRAYTDPFLTELMTEAYPLWRELDELAGGGILHETGLLFVGQHHSPNVGSMTSGLKAQGVEFSVLTDSGPNCPFRRSEGEVGVHVKEAGWVNAQKAISALQDFAKQHGAKFVQKRFPEGFQAEDFDAVVLTVGGWIKQFVPSLPVTVSKQTFGYVPVFYQGGPVWIMDDHLGTYGFPPEPDSGQIKIGIHCRGPTLKPDTDPRHTEEADLDEIRQFATDRFGIEGPVISEPKTCVYTSTENEDFKWGRVTLPEISIPCYFASPCSGHGFKFGPWVGERMANFVDGTRSFDDYPRFSFS